MNQNDAFNYNTLGSCCVSAVHLDPLNTTPEEFENWGFTLKTHQIFSVHAKAGRILKRNNLWRISVDSRSNRANEAAFLNISGVVQWLACRISHVLNWLSKQIHSYHAMVDLTFEKLQLAKLEKIGPAIFYSRIFQ